VAVGYCLSCLLSCGTALGPDAQSWAHQGEVGGGAQERGCDRQLDPVALDCLDGGGAYLIGGRGAHPGRWLGAGVGEHAGFADEAGRDEGDTDTAGGEVGAETEGEAAEAELGRVVDRRPWARRLAGKRGDEEEMARTLLQHRWIKGTGEQHRGLEVDAERPLQLLGAELVQLPGRR